MHNNGIIAPKDLVCSIENAFKLECACVIGTEVFIMSL